MGNQRVRSFEKLYENSVQDVFRYLSLRLDDRERVIDLTQETFVRLWNSYFRQEKEIKNERALIFKIAHNLLVNSYERHHALNSLDEINEAGHDFSDESDIGIEEKIDNEILISKIDKLESKYKEVLYLRFVQGMKVSEIVNILNESESVVSVRIHRGVKKLKEIYGK